MAETKHQKMFHSKFSAQRRRLLDQLRNADTELCTKCENRIRKCGEGAAVFKDEEGFIVVATARCKSRLCPTCATTRSNRCWARLKSMIDKIDEIRFLTLTLAPREGTLKEQIAYLRAAWTKLRRRKDLKNKLRGGVSVIEVTHNAKTDRWHPHIHIVFSGTYIKHSVIKKNWLEITKDSSIVDIRRISSRMAAVNYLAKYVSKTSTIPDTAKHRVAEWVEATNGLREFATFGEMHAKMEEDEKKSRELHHVLFLNQLAEGAHDKHAGCTTAYRRLLTLPDRPSDPELDPSILEVHTAAWEFALEQFGQYLAELYPPEEKPPEQNTARRRSTRIENEGVLWL